MIDPVSLRVPIDEDSSVSALLLLPDRAVAGFVFAHGAGAGMHHAFMTQAAAALCDRGVATLRYQFPSMDQGLKRPDPPAVAHRAVRAAVAEAARRLPGTPLFAGGKSFGGRMTSQAQAEQPLPGVLGLIFLGFPLHPAGKPSTQRADHLARVDLPMLFLQGTRDALAELELIEEVVATLGARATLRTIEDADHAFHVRVKSGSSDDRVLSDIASTTARWIAEVAAR